MLHTVETLPLRLRAAVISRIKIMAQLNIAERRLPQDGRIKSHCARARDRPARVDHAHHCTARASCCASSTAPASQLDFAALGLPAPAHEAFAELLDQPNGIILVTGPTGSGKTTTLYTALNALNTAERKIFTVEDPIEYQLRRRQPDPGAAADRADVRARAALDPAPGPRHHHGRRDPRPGDGADRDPGGADRPPRALDPAHQQRRRHRHAPARHGGRGLSAGLDAERRAGAAAGAPALCGLRRARRRPASYCWTSFGTSRTRHAELPQSSKACAGKLAVPFAATPAFSAAPPSASCWSSPTQCASACSKRYRGGNACCGAGQRHGHHVRDGLAKALRGETTIEEVLRVTRMG